MGGKNPLLVVDDADLEIAATRALQGALYSTGQRCTASSRLIVTAGIHDAFISALRDRMKALVVNDARVTGTDIGPVVDANSSPSMNDTSRLGDTKVPRSSAAGALYAPPTVTSLIVPSCWARRATRRSIVKRSSGLWRQ